MAKVKTLYSQRVSYPGVKFESKVTARGRAIGLFSVKDRNNIFRSALNTAADVWIEKFLPLRFSGYARRVLGYRSKPNAKSHKVFTTVAHKGKTYTNRDPYVRVGTFARAALSGARGQSRSTTTKGARMVVKIPRPHAMRGKDQRPFSKLPKSEKDALAKVFESNLVALIESGEETRGRGKTRRRLPSAVHRVS